MEGISRGNWNFLLAFTSAFDIAESDSLLYHTNKFSIKQHGTQ
jgi:hypothetical protein